jgi:hypothetical protein
MMDFEQLLDRLWGFDYECFAHDTLMVAINYRTREERVFHNSSPDDYETFLTQENPILMGYNCKSYDKYILKACILGYGPDEVKEINDHIIAGNNGWDYPFVGYCTLPPIWDLFDCIKTFKSLKEIEGNLRMNITETTIPFDLPTKWNKQEFDEVLYYCRADVNALFPLFERLINSYKSKFTICKIGSIDPQHGLGMTDANLTATLLGAERQEHDDPFLYEYPEQIQKEKIPQEALDYFDDLISHNDLNYKREAPCLDLKTIDFQLGVGGCHGFSKNGTYTYDRGDGLTCG